MCLDFFPDQRGEEVDGFVEAAEHQAAGEFGQKNRVFGIGPGFEALLHGDVVKIGEFIGGEALAEKGFEDRVLAGGPREAILGGQPLGALERELDHPLGSPNHLVKVDIPVHVVARDWRYASTAF